MMPLRKLTLAALTLGVLLLAPTSSAEAPRGFVLDRLDPSERGSEWFVLDSLDLRGHLRPAAGVVGSFTHKPLVVYDRDWRYVASLVEHQVLVHPGASIVLWSRMRAAISLPIAVYQTGDFIVGAPSPAAAVGDLRVSGDVRVVGEHGGPITGALGVSLYVPTGSRDDYMSDGRVRFLPRATVAGDLSIFTYSARVGYHHRTLTTLTTLTHTLASGPFGSEIVFGAAAGVRLADRKLVVGPELYGASILDGGSFAAGRRTPIEGLIGAHYTVADVRFGGGLGAGLTRGWGTPALRAILSAEWTPGYSEDTDKDGIPNADDACPDVAGARTTDPKTNGCPPRPAPPPPSDRDGDGVVDGVDACPDVAGVESRDPKRRGCPADRDEDGVVDLVDACPDAPGPASDDPKTNGCPPDRDDDAIPDSTDACPDLAGQPSDEPLRHGCPPDKDGDGIYDAEDACPDAPGPADPDPKRHGCPLARIEDCQIRITSQVSFKPGSAEILRESDPTLLAVATTLEDHPEIMMVRVEGHTDNTGNAATNQRLSEKRAEAVVRSLASYGIDKARLEVKGYGMTRPLDTNATAEGRQNNRRVELHIRGASGASTDAGRPSCP